MKVSIIGAGAMGGSIARGLMSRRLDEANHATPGYDITASNPSEGKLTPLAKLGANVTHDNTVAVKDADLVILCVKPWLVEQVINEIKPHVCYASTEVAIVAAGIPMTTLAEWLRKPGESSELPAFCISMPNTAVSQCQSMTFQVDNSQPCSRTRGIFRVRLGHGHPGATAPRSYLARLMRHSICHALCPCGHGRGVELGFRAGEAQEIIVQTLLGAASLLSLPGSHPESEIDKVTTPSGITIRGLNAMEHSGFTSAVINGLKASTKL